MYGVWIRCLFSIYVGICEGPLSVETSVIRIPRFFLCRGCNGILPAHSISLKMSIHIGQRIKEELERQGRSKVWLAQAINRSRTVCYNIFKNPTIDTGLLIQISKALNHDFLKDLSENESLPQPSKK